MIAKKIKFLKNNFDYFAENFLKIKDKNSQIVNFTLNSSQKRLVQIIQNESSKNKPIFVLILKARQIGFSTLTEALIFHQVIFNKNLSSLIVAHEDQASTNLFGMSKLYYDMLPAPLKPQIKASNAKELVFDAPNGQGLRSKIVIQSARNVMASRSGTYNILHLSEIDFWNNPSEAMTAIMQTVPMTKKTLVIVESTANGFGGYLHKLWLSAKRGDNDFIPFFVPWHAHEEYNMTLPNDFDCFTSHSVFGNEVELKELYGLKDEQIYWRRWTIANKCNNDIEIFKQEYPSNDTEAFLTSGRGRFNASILADYSTKTLLPIAQGIITKLENGYKILDGGKKEIEIYQPKNKRSQYLISADVSEGLEHGDYSVAKVFDMATEAQVAEWHGHIEHANFGKVLVDLGRIYNNAVLAVEANNHGHSVLTQIRNETYHDGNIFVGAYLNVSADDEYKDPMKRYGWFTTAKSKRIIIDNLAKMIASKEIQAFNKQDIDELYAYVIDEKGGTNAMAGAFDDRVMSLAIGYYLLRNEKFRQGYVKKIEDWWECKMCRYFNKLKCSKFGNDTKVEDVCGQFRYEKEYKTRR